eukprot:4331314-Pyramimonas_sp.AAC.1
MCNTASLVAAARRDNFIPNSLAARALGLPDTLCELILARSGDRANASLLSPGGQTGLHDLPATILYHGRGFALTIVWG